MWRHSVAVVLVHLVFAIHCKCNGSEGVLKYVQLDIGKPCEVDSSVVFSARCFVEGALHMSVYNGEENGVVFSKIVCEDVVVWSDESAFVHEVASCKIGETRFVQFTVHHRNGFVSDTYHVIDGARVNSVAGNEFIDLWRGKGVEVTWALDSKSNLVHEEHGDAAEYKAYFPAMLPVITGLKIKDDVVWSNGGDKNSALLRVSSYKRLEKNDPHAESNPEWEVTEVHWMSSDGKYKINMYALEEGKWELKNEMFAEDKDTMNYNNRCLLNRNERKHKERIFWTKFRHSDYTLKHGILGIVYPVYEVNEFSRSFDDGTERKVADIVWSASDNPEDKQCVFIRKYKIGVVDYVQLHIMKNDGTIYHRYFRWSFNRYQPVEYRHGERAEPEEKAEYLISVVLDIAEDSQPPRNVAKQHFVDPKWEMYVFTVRDGFTISQIKFQNGVVWEQGGCMVNEVIQFLSEGKRYVTFTAYHIDGLIENKYFIIDDDGSREHSRETFVETSRMGGNTITAGRGKYEHVFTKTYGSVPNYSERVEPIFKPLVTALSNDVETLWIANRDMNCTLELMELYYTNEDDSKLVFGLHKMDSERVYTITEFENDGNEWKERSEGVSSTTCGKCEEYYIYQVGESNFADIKTSFTYLGCSVTVVYPAPGYCVSQVNYRRPTALSAESALSDDGSNVELWNNESGNQRLLGIVEYNFDQIKYIKLAILKDSKVEEKYFKFVEGEYKEINVVQPPVGSEKSSDTVSLSSMRLCSDSEGSSSDLVGSSSDSAGSSSDSAGSSS